MGRRAEYYGRGLMVSVSVMLLALLFSATSGVALSLLALIGLFVAVGSFGAAVWFGYHLILERRMEKYDLSRLFDIDDELPADLDENDPNGPLFCDHCGVGYPADYPVCPSCGRVTRRLL